MELKEAKKAAVVAKKEAAEDVAIKMYGRAMEKVEEKAIRSVRVLENASDKENIKNIFKF